MTQTEFALFQQRQTDLKQFIGVLTQVVNAHEISDEAKKLATAKIKELIPMVSLDPPAPPIVKSIM